MSVYNPETEEIIVDNLAESFEKVAAKPIYDNADISDLKEYHPVFGTSLFSNALVFF